VACQGYHAPVVRTGYEEIIAHRSGPTFAVTAKKPGEVIAMNSKGMVVRYEDGKEVGIELGRKFGNASGMVVPHDIISDLKIGDKFIVGDAIAYNSGFFERDLFNPKRVIFKNATLVWAAILESSGTMEDASIISPRMAEKLSSRVSESRTIVLTCDQYVSQLVQIGDKLEFDSVLCLIQNEATGSSGLFSAANVETLKALQANSPKARVKGVVDSVEVYYHCDLGELSDSLKLLAKQSNERLKKKFEASRQAVFTGQVDGGYRIKGEPLAEGSVAIKIMITSEIGTGVGDKIVVANQMKSVVSGVMEGEYMTEDRQPIDLHFGAESFDKRVVNSPYKIGLQTTVQYVVSQKAQQMYFEGIAA